MHLFSPNLFGRNAKNLEVIGLLLLKVTFNFESKKQQPDKKYKSELIQVFALVILVFCSLYSNADTPCIGTITTFNDTAATLNSNTTCTNTGNLAPPDGQAGMFSQSSNSNTTFNNSGVINITNASQNGTAGTYLGGIVTTGDGSVVTNSGTINVTGDNSAGVNIGFSGVANSFTNTTSGVINVSGSNGSFGVADVNNQSSLTLINNGQIILTNVINGAAVYAASNGTSISNTNQISANGDGTHGIKIDTQSFVTITNSGNITTTGNSGNAIYSWGTSTALFNSGLISSTGTSTDAILNDSSWGSPSFSTLTNIGTIKSSTGFGINNQGAISVLNNAQGAGNTNGPLTLTGNLPLAYNLIISSQTQYGKLSVSIPSGPMAFNIYGNTGTTLVSGVNASSVSAFRYLGVLQGFTNLTGITGTTGTYTGGYSYNLVEETASPGIWDLVVTGGTPPAPTGPSAVDTQAALLQSASALRSVFNQQTAVVNNSLNYDCAVFAENGLCVSGGGRVATTNSITGERASTLLVAAYKALNNMRVGAYIDQNVPANNVTGISMDKSPMYGVFGVWNQRQDAIGYEVRLATAYSNQNITQTRNVVGTSEAGVGTTSLTTQATSAVVSYAMPVTDSTWIASPYVGIRKTKVTRGGYTETSAVTAPLTYSDLNQDITTAMAGVRTNKKLGDNFYVMGSVGVEQNVGSNISTLDATGVTGLTATDFSANYAKTRPVASVGASYAIAKDQRISLSAMYRKEAFQSSGSTTGMLMYQVGL